MFSVRCHAQILKWKCFSVGCRVKSINVKDFVWGPRGTLKFKRSHWGAAYNLYIQRLSVGCPVKPLDFNVSVGCRANPSNLNVFWGCRVKHSNSNAFGRVLCKIPKFNKRSVGCRVKLQSPKVFGRGPHKPFRSEVFGRGAA